VALILRFNEVSDALAPYTAVDTDEVLQRLQASLVPWHTQAPATIARIHRRPDLKGPTACLLAVLLVSTAVHRGEGWSEYTLLGRVHVHVTNLTPPVGTFTTLCCSQNTSCSSTHTVDDSRYVHVKPI
jgi:hypothetical protein